MQYFRERLHSTAIGFSARSAASKQLPEVTLHNLRVASSTVTIRFWGEDNRSRFEILSSQGDLQVQQGPPPGVSTNLPLPVTEPEEPPLSALKEAYYEAGAQLAHAFGAWV